jgi:glyoxylate reductase
MKIFITRPIDDEGIKLLRARDSFEISMNKENESLSKQELIDLAKGSVALVPLLSDKVDKEVIDALLPELKIIANYAVGFDNIDIEYAAQKGIIVTNTPEVMTQAVAEHAVALMLSCARRIVEGDRYVREGKYDLWEPNLLLGPEIAGKTLGIIGMGRIGQALCQIAYHGFGMKLLYHDINRNEEIERNFQAEHTSVNSLLGKSDFVSLHVPLLDSTKHMISAEQLKAMKKSAILVNTARGAIVDEQALISALKDKEIFAAGLDVYEKEGEVNPEFYKLANVVLTPHIASATHEARLSMGECVSENIIEVLAGRPAKTPVN